MTYKVNSLKTFWIPDLIHTNNNDDDDDDDDDNNNNNNPSLVRP
jgi:hypothetical protein